MIAIGASAGGVEALKEIVRGLPPDLPASVLIVNHLSPHHPTYLPEILSNAGALPVSLPRDSEEIVRGHVYLAPPDYHMVVKHGRIYLGQGPKENFARPAIDPLFRSAALAYGSQLIGVILTGAQNDGTSGLWAVKERGGVAIVQDPKDAYFPSMPQSALDKVKADYCLPVSEIAPVLIRLANDPVEEEGEHLVPEKLQLETGIAKEEVDANQVIEKLGTLSAYTCPECHGVLWVIHEGEIIRFRCRTGHAYTAEALRERLSESIENILWDAVRALEESAALARHIAEASVKGEGRSSAENLIIEAQSTERLVDSIRRTMQAYEQTFNASPQ
ncbi:MAG TPA: chemotaxis protein CheB [Pyrinomonadaceae bacterium]|nr:chemotaxis protein CheB [Pyrinomonadaceae bacterium]